MPKWEAGLISKDAKYRNTTNSSTGGIWGLNEQLRHKNADNWPDTAGGVVYPITSNEGYWVEDMTIITTSVQADNADNYSVHLIAMPTTVDTGRIYIAIEITANTRYWNDVCIGAVQITTDGGDNMDASNDFMMHDDGNDWQRAGGTEDTAGNNTLSSVSGYTWTNISTAVTTTRRFNRYSSTNSTYTGAQGGLDEGTGYNIYDELSLSIGDNPTQMPQADGNHFIYSESSSTSANAILWCRSPEFTVVNPENGPVMAIAYHACTRDNASGMVNTTGERLMRVFWEEA